MQIKQKILVFDAPDLEAESSFWSALLGGKADAEDDWHTVYDADGRPYLGFQLAPDFVPPVWPGGPQQQQLHLDIYVEDVAAAHEEALRLGARLLQPAKDINSAEGFQVYADPAGHPFCLCWG
jgi:predicted enzyme related to lactoylglutathione lyase